MSNEVAVKSEESTQLTPATLSSNMLETIKISSAIKPADVKFLTEHAQHLQVVCEKTFMWRTKQQKLSIISDTYHPTLHSKFHQAILEQKVFFEQAVALAKDFEMAKADLEILQIEIEELQHTEELNQFTSRKNEVITRKKQIEAQAKLYALQQMQVAMNYRMAEIKDWQEIQVSLINEMKAQGADDDFIWSKESGEVESQFFMFLTNFQGIYQSKDGAEINNLIALARHGVEQAIAYGLFEKFVAQCNPVQLKALRDLGYLKTK